MKFLSNLNLNKNELQNAVLHPLGTPPSNPKLGQIYYDTSAAKNELKIYTGSAWDMVGKEYDGTIVLTENKTLTITDSTTIGTNAITLASGKALTMEHAGLTVGAEDKTGNITITSNNTTAKSLTLASSSTIGALTNGHVLFANGANTIGSEAQLAVSRGGTGIGTYAIGQILYSHEDNNLTALNIGAAGEVLRVVDMGTEAEPKLVPKWSTGGSVDNPFILKFDGGATENRDLFTFDGSAEKTIDFKGGNLITLDDTTAGEITIQHDALAEAYTTTEDTETTLSDIQLLSELDVDGSGHVSAGAFRKLVAGTAIGITATNDGNITIKHSDISRSDTTTTNGDAPGFTGTFDVVDLVNTNDQGHVTSINVTTITMPTETQLSVTPGSGVFFDQNPTVDDHAITFSRSNSTKNTVTVGELVISVQENDPNPDTTGNLTVGGNAVIAGNLTVQGTTTTLDTQTVLIKDNIIEINSSQTGTPASSLLSGIEVNRGDEDNFQFVFVEQTDDFRLGKVGGALQPVLTRDEVGNLAEGDILVYDSTGKKAIGKTFDELKLPQKYAETIGNNVATSFNIDHGLGTDDVVVTVREVGGDKEIVYTQTVVSTTGRVIVSFAEAPTTNQYRVVVIG